MQHVLLYAALYQATLQLKRKRSPLRVRLPDESTKVVLVDETQTVMQIVKVCV